MFARAQELHEGRHGLTVEINLTEFEKLCVFDYQSDFINARSEIDWDCS